MGEKGPKSFKDKTNHTTSAHRGGGWQYIPFLLSLLLWGWGVAETIIDGGVSKEHQRHSMQVERMNHIYPGEESGTAAAD